MPAVENAPIDSDNIFVGRQPIFDRELNVRAYELLFRAGNDMAANVIDGTNATSEVIINAFLEIGMQNITNGQLAFINLTRDYITGAVPLPLEPHDVVLEVLEDIEVDDELITALKEMSEKGFMIALDDYVFTDDKEPLMDIVDIVKVDIMGMDPKLLSKHLPGLQKHGVKILAEKVETQQDFEMCMTLGFDYFQGYFFCKPNVMSGKSMPTNRLAVMEMMAKLQSPDCDFNELEGIISHDVGISYKLMRILNSAYYSMPSKVESIHQALLLLGLKAIRNWVTVIALTNISDKPHELIVNSLLRAQMCMELGKRTKGSNPDMCFTVGLFSTLDALMDQPLDLLLSKLPLNDDIIEALTRHEGLMGRILKVVNNYEQGQWQDIEESHISPGEIRDIYFTSLRWASELASDMTQTA